MKKIIYPFVLLLCWFALQPARAELTIEITSGTEGALPIAVVPFGWGGPGVPPEDVAGIVAADLTRSGQFAPLPEADMLSKPVRPEDISFRDWRAVGVDNLVIGRITPQGEGRYTVDFRLFDVFRGRQLSGYSFPTTRERLRETAHRVADIVYEALTGERGAFRTWIAYVTVTGDGDDRRYSLQVADSDGHNPRTVLRSRQPLMSPAWSPDARRLAYVTFEQETAEIYVQELASGERRKVASHQGINGAPAWSPDGRRLALTLSQDGNAEIYILSLDSDRLRRLTRHPGIDTEPAWAPDGRSLVFTSDRGGSPQLYRLAIDGGRPERLTFEGGYNASADFAPDGRHLALLHRDGRGAYRVAVQDLERGMLNLVSEGQLDESPSFAPNGRMILYATEVGGRGVLAAASVDGRVGQRLRLQEGVVREPAWSPFLE
ncbi:Tol-Pal system beta propeller repeat protein TolB [Thiohalobacter thiocyanaticus]|uniref:Tol-Pal system protein TolB n=2 Tax=Thiohalobacter thiocyanaticus TaxID=585455 RepID=A0A426QMQ9_9GAMM|nr:Tol-Pal system beta propeller repeat protein TolB [Thiohalobacter thiocyanaticus]RRQ23017.1 Tol-Pal system beta propeller repeat protein TolB [Thiohalobacter thiocyanaticus]